MNTGQLQINWANVPARFKFVCVDCNVVWAVEGRPVWREPEDQEEYGDWVDEVDETGKGKDMGEWKILLETSLFVCGPGMMFERPAVAE